MSTPNELLTLAAIAALEAGDAQSRADVAQSIYNRVADYKVEPRPGYGGNVYEAVIADGQYQPAYVNPNVSSGSGTKTASVWKNITDEDSAVRAMRYYYDKKGQSISDSAIRKQLRDSVAAITNPGLQANAARHVGGRTEFLGANEDVRGPDVVWRGTRNDNKYYAQYGTRQQLQRGPAEVPESISSTSSVRKTGTEVFNESLIEDPLTPAEEEIQQANEEGEVIDSTESEEDDDEDDDEEETVEEEKEDPELTTTTGTAVTLADPCKNNFFDIAEAHLENFFNKVTNAANVILNLPNEIKIISRLLTGAASGYIGSLTEQLSGKIAPIISNGLTTIANNVEELLTGKSVTEVIKKTTEEQGKLEGPIKKLFAGLECLASKVIDAAENIFGDIINDAIKTVLNVPVCAVTQILSEFNNKVVNIIDSVVEPLLGPFRKAFDFIFNVKDFIFGSIDVIKKVSNLFKCGEKQKCPTSSKYIIDKGLAKDRGEEEQKGFLQQALTQGSLGSSPPCYTGNVLECGIPKVEFFGGGGSGAAGRVILGNFVNELDTEGIVGSVQKTASIVGVEIEDPGSGYEDAPFITFSDNCDKGYGAYGRAVIQGGRVTSILITSIGENYPTETDQQDEVFYIDDVIIENPGTNYDEDDTVEGLELTISNGRVTAVGIKDVAFNGYPDLNINSSTGYGAILRPVMRIVPPQKEVVQVIDCVR